MNIEIYSKDHCPFCDKAVHKAQAMMQERSDIKTAVYKLNEDLISDLSCIIADIKTAVYKLNEDFSREELFEKFPTARTFPQIAIDGKGIGGWVEFEKI